MKNAILIHGRCDKEEFLSDIYPSASNSHWFPWLQKELGKVGINTQTPEMPMPYDPEYSEWKHVFEQFYLHSETILVGYSCGAGFLLRYLSEKKIKIQKLILVAPWLDPQNKQNSFMDFTIDPGLVDRVREIHVLFSHDDSEPGVKESIETITHILPTIHLHPFENMGHFTFDEMKTTQFPELFELIVSENTNQ